MEVRILNTTQETVIVCQEAFVNYGKGYMTLEFVDDDVARINEDVIKKIGGKTIHCNATITITNLSDFNFTLK